MANTESVGLVILGLTAVPAIMSAYLPSPSTAYKDGADPKRVEWLKRDAIIGASLSMGVALGASMLASRDMGAAGWLIFVGSAAMLGAFLYEYNYAVQCGRRDGNTYGN